MKLADELFISDKIKDTGTVSHCVRQNIQVTGLFCLCIKEEGPALLEIISSRELFKERNIKKNYTIVGLAKGKEDALSLTEYVFSYAIKNSWDLKNLKTELQRADF